MRNRTASFWLVALWGSFALAAAPPPSSGPSASSPEQLLSGIAGMDFSQLSAPAQRELATIFADEFCYCGCPHTLGGCLKQHASCKHSRRMAQLAASAAAEGSPATEILVGLAKYYGSFRQARKTFQVDERMCKGPAAAKVTVVEFSDFECPYCAVARPLLEELAQSQSELRLCFLPFPLTMHPNAIPATQAVLFARDAGKFWQMHDLLFENQARLSLEVIVSLAGKLGLDIKALKQAMQSGKYNAEIEGFKQQGRAAAVDSTPSVYMNGRKYNLGLSKATLVHSIEDELEWGANKGAWAAD